MPFVAVPQTCLVTIEGRMDNQLTINDLYFVNSGAVTALGIGTLLLSVQGWVTGSLCPLLSEDWSAVRVRGVDLSIATGPAVERATAQPGLVTSEAAPNNVAACVSFRTDQRGRSARGRNFVPGIPNAEITLNTLSPTFITDLIAAYFELVGAGDFVPGWQWCVVSRVFEGDPRPTPLTIPITDVVMVGNSVRSMRSREIGHGA